VPKKEGKNETAESVADDKESGDVGGEREKTSKNDARSICKRAAAAV
jgi:hypothetical protein